MRYLSSLAPLVGITGVLTGFFTGPALAAEDGVTLDLDVLETLRPSEPQEPSAILPQTTIIDFTPGAADPTDESRLRLDTLADTVRDAPARLTVVAYAGRLEGQTDNDAKRLALRRAINLRQILVAGGIAGTRVNLQPEGAKPDGEGNSEHAEIILRQP